jgi:hypothetical protein
MCRFLKTSRTRFHYPGQHSTPCIHSVHSIGRLHLGTPTGINGGEESLLKQVSTTDHYMGWRRLIMYVPADYVVGGGD